MAVYGYSPSSTCTAQCVLRRRHHQIEVCGSVARLFRTDTYMIEAPLITPCFAVTINLTTTYQDAFAGYVSEARTVVRQLVEVGEAAVPNVSALSGNSRDCFDPWVIQSAFFARTGISAAFG